MADEYSVITLQDLENLAKGGCSNPTCDHSDHSTLFLHARCHPHKTGVEVKFTLGTNHLLISCMQCHKPIAAIEVANAEGEEWKKNG